MNTPYTHVAAQNFYVVAGSQIIATDLNGREAHRLAFRTFQSERGARRVQVLGHRTERVFETFGN